VDLDALAPWRDRTHFDAPGLAAPVVVGCSGGADSLALLALAVDAGLEPVAVHVDHGLRAGSAEEQRAVEAVVATVGAGFLATRVTIEPAGDLEARARSARYDALRRARADVGASVVLVGHTQDDQAETVLLNLMRGAAGAGLAGMAQQRDGIVRPLLGLRRDDTEAICTVLGLPVVHDPMNDDLGLRRVAVRRDLLPQLNAIAGRDLVPVLARQSDVFREESQFLDELAVASWPGDGDRSAAALRTLPPVVARRAVRSWLGPPPPSRAEVQRVLDVAQGVVRATELTGGRVVRRAEGRLHIDPR
jgi:tRNA(Ile)-lysidine synthase